MNSVELFERSYKLIEYLFFNMNVEVKIGSSVKKCRIVQDLKQTFFNYII